MAKAAKKPAKRAKAKSLEKSKGGRPSKYSETLVKAICARLALGEPMAVICRDDGMPDTATVWRWAEASPDVSQAIARAREDGHDRMAAECLEIADDGTNDYVTKKNANGTEYETVDSEHIQRSKLRIDTRLKLLAKWDPKRYGDKVQLANHEGGELPAPSFVIQPVAVLKPE